MRICGQWVLLNDIACGYPHEYVYFTLFIVCLRMCVVLILHNIIIIILYACVLREYLYTVCMFMPYSVHICDMHCTNLYTVLSFACILHTHGSQNTYICCLNSLVTCICNM